MFRKKGDGGVRTRAPSQGLAPGRPTLRRTSGRDSSLPGPAGLPGRAGGQSLVPGVPGPRGGLQPGLPAGRWRGSFTPSSRHLASGTPSLDTMHYNPGCWQDTQSSLWSSPVDGPAVDLWDKGQSLCSQTQPCPLSLPGWPLLQTAEFSPPLLEGSSVSGHFYSGRL